MRSVLGCGDRVARSLIRLCVTELVFWESILKMLKVGLGEEYGETAG